MKTLKGFISILSITIFAAFAASAQVNLTSIDGASVNVENQRGKVVVLAIGASWLPLSGKQSDIASALAKKYQGQNVVVYFVVTDSTNAKSKNFASDETIRKFAGTNKLGMTVLRDPEGATTLRRYKVDQVPSFVVLDKTGKPADDPFGGIDPTGKYDIAIPISKAIDRAL